MRKDRLIHTLNNSNLISFEFLLLLFSFSLSLLFILNFVPFFCHCNFIQTEFGPQLAGNTTEASLVRSHSNWIPAIPSWSLTFSLLKPTRRFETQLKTRLSVILAGFFFYYQESFSEDRNLLYRIGQWPSFWLELPEGLRSNSSWLSCSHFRFRLKKRAEWQLNIENALWRRLSDRLRVDLNEGS